jgi:hypothetical protein
VTVPAPSSIARFHTGADGKINAGRHLWSKE